MRRIIYILILSWFSLGASYGQKDATIKFDSSSTSVSGRLKLPPPSNGTGWTNDFEHILLPAEIDTLDSIIKHFADETTIQIAIVSLDSSYTSKADFDEYITALGNAWGIGLKNGNNGIVIGISASLRKLRISNGYGIEAKLSDIETKAIIDEFMVPEFKEGKYYNGLKKGLAVITVKLR